MYCTYLQLKDFRNYRQLDLSLGRGMSVFQGENAAGKTTLLEALYMLATTKSGRAGGDQELVSFEASPEFGVPAFSRLSAKIQRAEDELEAEIVLTRDTTPGDNSEVLPAARKRVKINGAPKRAVDLVGQINVVLFSPEDLDLVIGSPSLRRRYFDITLSQVDHRYFRTLQEYSKIVAQRNGYLRNYRERQRALKGRTGYISAGSRDNLELSIWDEELIKTGAYITKRRKECLDGLNRRASAFHANLLGMLSDEAAPNFELVYQPSFPLPAEEADERKIADLFAAHLAKVREQEFARAVSLVGPHRDDFIFQLEGKNLSIYGSRGQQRTSVLSLKLAEAAWMEQQRGDRPILLLDDILSELDAGRRQYVLDTVQATAQQVLITTTDFALFHDTEQLKQIASLYQVGNGRVKPL
jgi:DNA replication and repair protein RecF